MANVDVTINTDGFSPATINNVGRDDTITFLLGTGRKDPTVTVSQGLFETSVTSLTVRSTSTPVPITGNATGGYNFTATNEKAGGNIMATVNLKLTHDIALDTGAFNPATTPITGEAQKDDFVTFKLGTRTGTHTVSVPNGLFGNFTSFSVGSTQVRHQIAANLPGVTDYGIEMPSMSSNSERDKGPSTPIKGTIKVKGSGVGHKRKGGGGSRGRKRLRPGKAARPARSQV